MNLRVAKIRPLLAGTRRAETPTAEQQDRLGEELGSALGDRHGSAEIIEHSHQGPKCLRQVVLRRLLREFHLRGPGGRFGDERREANQQGVWCRRRRRNHGAMSVEDREVHVAMCRSAHPQAQAGAGDTMCAGHCGYVVAALHLDDRREDVAGVIGFSR